MTPGATKQFDPDHVLEQAMELFWEQGYEATGLAQLTEHLGIGRQSLYNEFGDKRGLFLAALRAYVAHCHSEKLAILNGPGSPLENLHALGQFWLESFDSTSCQGCLLSNTIAEFGDSDEDVNEIVVAAIRSMEDAFCGLFQRAIDAGELREDTNPRNLARMFIATTQGVSLLSRFQDGATRVKSTLEALTSMLPLA